MKKLISLFFFAAALSWTWCLTTGKSGVSFETHAGIQEKLAELILDVIKAKKPLAIDVEITRLWTENIDDHKVRAVFSYKFKEDDESQGLIEQSVEGEAVLYRQEGETPQQDHWALQSVKTTHNGLVFDEGLTISPSGVSLSSESAPKEPASSAAEGNSPQRNGAEPLQDSTPGSSTPETSH